MRQADVLRGGSPALMRGLPPRAWCGGAGSPSVRAGILPVWGPISHHLLFCEFGRGACLQQVQRCRGLSVHPYPQVAPIGVLGLVIDIRNVRQQLMPCQVVLQHAFQPNGSWSPASPVPVLQRPALEGNRELVELDGPFDLASAVDTEAPRPLYGPCIHAAQGGIIFDGLERAARENRVPGHAGECCPLSQKTNGRRRGGRRVEGVDAA